MVADRRRRAGMPCRMAWHGITFGRRREGSVAPQHYCQPPWPTLPNAPVCMHACSFFRGFSHSSTIALRADGYGSGSRKTPAYLGLLPCLEPVDDTGPLSRVLYQESGTRCQATYHASNPAPVHTRWPQSHAAQKQRVQLLPPPFHPRHQHPTLRLMRVLPNARVRRRLASVMSA